LGSAIVTLAADWLLLVNYQVQPGYMVNPD